MTHKQAAACASLALVLFAGPSQAAPNAPTNLMATADNFVQTTVSWTDTSADEDGFKVERSTDGISFTQAAQLPPNITVYRDRRLWPGATYYYRVRAWNAAGDSDYSNVASAITALGAGFITAWGWDGYYQTNVPAALTNAIAVSGGSDHVVALKMDGTVTAWGYNDLWQCGQTNVPANLTNVVAVAAGGNHSLALKRNGTVVGWGANNDGQINVPAGLTNVVAVAGGTDHSLALKADGTVVCWGRNNYGQASPPPGLTNVVAIAGGQGFSLALKADGTVVAWGEGDVGQTNVPPGLSNVVAIACGIYHGLALKGDGSLIAWGWNCDGSTTVPSGLTDVVAIAAGAEHNLALRSNRAVVAWGYNGSGQTNVPSTLTNAVTVGSCLASVSLVLSQVTHPPLPPSNLTATFVPTNGVDLAWTDNATDESGFGIDRALDTGGVPGTWVRIATVGPNVTHYSDRGLGLCATYWYRVYTFSTGGSSLCSSSASATLPCGPAPPTDLAAAVVTTNEVDLTWTDNASDEIGFFIERAPDAAGAPGTWMRIATLGPNVTHYSDTGLGLCATYWYRVCAYNPNGSSAYSSASASLPCLPAAPSALRVTFESTNLIALAWTDNSTNEIGFGIERALDSNGAPGAWAQVGTVGANLTSFSDTALSPCAIYWYRVKAFGTIGDSACCSPASASTSLAAAQVSGSTNLCSGGAAVVQAALTGTPPWNLVWSDGFQQLGVTSSPAIRVVSPSTYAAYSVVSVSDANCAAGRSSGLAIVRMLQPPVMASQPANVTACEGATIGFSVGASGAALNGPSAALGPNSAQPASCNCPPTPPWGADFHQLPPGLSASSIVTPIAWGNPNLRVYRVAPPPAPGPDTILVKPKKRIAPAKLLAHHQKINATVKRTFPRIGNLQVVKLPPGLAIEAALKHYRESGLVEYAEPDYRVHAILAPGDPHYVSGELWALNKIAAAKAWDIRTSADPLIVAIIDTGVWYWHADLAANMWSNPCVNTPVNGVVYPNDLHGINAITGTGDPLDDHFHGTHVAGTIGALGNNALGSVGIAWNVRIMACKFLDGNGYGAISDAIECIDYAVAKGAKVLNNSWGGGDYSQALHDAIAAARDADVIFVAAAGNNSGDNDHGAFYPASYAQDLDNVVAVAATDQNDQLAYFSNYGAGQVALGAPGVSIFSTLPAVQTSAMSSYGLSPNYGVASGTSMASPHVAGALALVWAQFPAESHSAIIRRLLNGTEPVSSLNGRTLTGGRLNLFNALTQPPQPPFWLAYQWRKNEVNLPGWNSSVCSFGPITNTDDGALFDAVISNPCGTVTSAAAQLAVLRHIQLTGQSAANVTECASNPAALWVSATGSAPRYRWRKAGGGWGCPWTLASSGPGSGSLFIGSSTNNGDRTYSSSFPTDIDSGGKALGINASGGHAMQVTRKLIEPLPPGGVFSLYMDNGYVAANGAAGFQLLSAHNEKWFEFFCTNNAYYFSAKNVPPEAADYAPFTTHGLSFYCDMMEPDLLIVVLSDSGTSEYGIMFKIEIPELTNDPPDHFVLYNKNAGPGPANDIYFNNLGAYEGYSLNSFVGSDSATEAAYADGWQNGDDGGTGPIPGATSRAYFIPACGPADNGAYNAILDNPCSFLTTPNITFTAQPGPCPPADTDHDGIPDWWVTVRFGHPTGLASDHSRAQDDADGDRMSNRAEYIAGTDPADPQSYLKIDSISGSSTNGINIAWGSISNRLYSVQRACDLHAGFTNLMQHASATPPTNTFFDATATNGSRFFYRIKVE